MMSNALSICQQGLEQRILIQLPLAIIALSVGLDIPQARMISTCEPSFWAGIADKCNICVKVSIAGHHQHTNKYLSNECASESIQPQRG